MTYILGIITGIGISALSLIGIGLYVVIFGKTTKRKLEQVQSVLKPKGKIFEPESLVDEWIEKLPKETSNELSEM